MGEGTGDRQAIAGDVCDASPEVPGVFRRAWIRGNLQRSGGDTRGGSRVQIRGEGISGHPPGEGTRDYDAGDGPRVASEFPRLRGVAPRARTEAVPLPSGAGQTPDDSTDGLEGGSRGGAQLGAVRRSSGSVCPRGVRRPKAGRGSGGYSSRRLTLVRGPICRECAKGKVVEAPRGQAPPTRPELTARCDGRKEPGRQGVPLRTDKARPRLGPSLPECRNPALQSPRSPTNLRLDDVRGGGAARSGPRPNGTRGPPDYAALPGARPCGPSDCFARGLPGA
jgi:hypothetical protein